jgi:hypothetical protein
VQPWYETDTQLGWPMVQYAIHLMNNVLTVFDFILTAPTILLNNFTIRDDCTSRPNYRGENLAELVD